MAYRLATIALDGESLPAVESEGRLFPLRDMLSDDEIARMGGQPSDLSGIFAEWDHWQSILPDRLADHVGNGADGLIPENVSFLPPIAAPDKLICIGANYWDHIREMGIPMEPKYPYSFLKPVRSTLRGSGTAVDAPRHVERMDWEAELAVVIGRRGKNIAAADALDFVAGYTNLNDLSARDCLIDPPGVGIDWVLHKAHDGFAPIGPYVVPAQFVPDPQNLPVHLSVNGVTKQESNTGQMVFGVAAIIEHLSTVMTLEPGDVIATGTPAGVGSGSKPPEFLKPGDVVTMEVGDFGVLETPIA